MKTIDWLKSQELETGGIAAWEGQQAYPECSGYLIPTLLSYGEKEFAERIADWLEKVQNGNGSFNGLDGIQRPFDTAACMEGLRAAGRDQAANRAQKWLDKMLLFGRLRIHADTQETHQYNLRALALAGLKLDSIPENELTPTRTHYMAYALEGLHNMGLDISGYLLPFAQGRTLLPFDTQGSDTCATAQIAVLCLKNNIACYGLVEAVRDMVDDDGGVWHGSGDHRKCAWTAKYYLDMEKLLKGLKETAEEKKPAIRTSRKTVISD
jgi:hypothetical protein